MLKTRVKSILKHLINLTAAGLGSNAVGRLVYAQVTGSAMGRTQEVAHDGVRLTFAIPNALNVYRATSFSTKEPETLAWIDGMPEGSVVWDIGGNVGLYSCYAAKHRRCRVFAFEPSVFNLELLARNIFLNGLTDLVTIVPLALAERVEVSTLNMSNTEWGGALSSFGQSFGHEGTPMARVFEFRTIGLSMVDAVSALGIPQPDYIKIDVDGIEHLILRGGLPVLRQVKGVLVEINDNFTTQATEASRCLREAGLTLREKTHAETFDSALGAERCTFNQIWSR
jgi:FkbM family methyltransferase